MKGVEQCLLLPEAYRSRSGRKLGDRVARTPAVFAPLLSLTFNRELNRLSEALIKESQACFRLRLQNSFTELHEQCNCATEVMASSEQMNNEPGRTLSGLL
jgi:hypothetical protein